LTTDPAFSVPVIELKNWFVPVGTSVVEMYFPNDAGPDDVDVFPAEPVVTDNRILISVAVMGMVYLFFGAY
jgi:hypothetical protein